MSPERMMSPLGLYEEAAKFESDEMEFRLNREPAPGQTFSKEGLTSIQQGIEAFILGRIRAHWGPDIEDPTVPGPSAMTVEVRVNIAGQSTAAPIGALPHYAVLDGERRTRHERRAKHHR